MRTRCYSCLCRTCIRICCDGDGKNCAGKRGVCGDYNGFRQLSLFGQDAGHHMRVLVACEESQRVCTEFRRLGHEAYSCDIEPFPGIARAMAEQWGKVGGSVSSQSNSVPRYSWNHYGISKERYRQLTEYIQSGIYASVARQVAHTANKDIAEYILLSVTQNKSYDALRVKWELKEMEQIPYCRTDFYGIRRYFVACFDKEMRRIGK